MATSRACRIVATLALCCLNVTSMPATAQEAGSEPQSRSIEAAIEVNSRYLWRGIAFSEGTVYQPSLTLTQGTWSISAWANVDPNPLAAPHWNEIDVTLANSVEWQGWSIETSGMLYAYPHVGVPPTSELQLELGRSIGRWSPYTRHSVDVLAAKGAAYSALGIGAEQAVRGGVILGAEAEFGRGWWRFASEYADPALEGMNVWSAGLSASVPAGEGVQVNVRAAWNQVGNLLVREQISGPTPVVFGLTLVRGF